MATSRIVRVHPITALTALALIATQIVAPGLVVSSHAAPLIASRSVAAPQTWGPIEKVSGRRFASPGGEVVIAPDGTATVAWATGNKIRVRQQRSGRAWGPIRGLGKGQQASIGVAGDGTVTLVWTRKSRGRPYEIVSVRGNGKRWSSPLVLGQSRLFPHAEVAVNRAGAVAAIWTTYFRRDKCEELVAAYRPGGGRWTPPEDLGCSWNSQALTIGPGGVATIAYDTDRGRRLAVSRRTGSGWVAPVSIPVRREALKADVNLPGIDVDSGASGEAVVVWQTQRRAYKTVRFAGGEFGKTQVLGGPANRIYDFLPSGDTTHVGARRDGSAVFTLGAGGGRETEELRTVDQTPAGELSPPDVIGQDGIGCRTAFASNDGGDAAIAWEPPIAVDEQGELIEPAALQVTFRARGSDVWAAPVDVSGASTFSSCYGVSMNMSRDGSVIVAWVGDVDGVQSILVRRTSPGS